MRRFYRAAVTRPPTGSGIYPLLVVASPRSGTRYTVRALAGAGFRLGHEKLSNKGTVSSYFVVDDYFYHGKHQSIERRKGSRFGQVWHQLRHPQRTIGSLDARIGLSWWKWQESHTGVSYDDPDAAARFWLDWTSKIEADPEVSWRYRIEDIETIWPEMLDRLGLERVPLPTLDRKTGETHGSTPKPLSVMDPRVAEAVAKRMSQYGYEEIE